MPPGAAAGAVVAADDVADDGVATADGVEGKLGSLRILLLVPMVVAAVVEVTPNRSRRKEAIS